MENLDQFGTYCTSSPCSTDFSKEPYSIAGGRARMGSRGWGAGERGVAGLRMRCNDWRTNRSWKDTAPADSFDRQPVLLHDEVGNRRWTLPLHCLTDFRDRIGVIQAVLECFGMWMARSCAWLCRATPHSPAGDSVCSVQGPSDTI